MLEVVKAAEGRSDVDDQVVQEIDAQPIPGDAELATPTSATFGVPESDDPDPFGVLALERAGLEIREAGSTLRPASSQFEFNPAPTSPIYHSFHRPSMDTLVNRSNRGSVTSTSPRGSIKRSSTDQSTQTPDEGPPQSPRKVSPVLRAQRQSPRPKSIREEPKVDQIPVAKQPEEVDYTKIDLDALGVLRKNDSQEFDGTTVSESPAGSFEDDAERRNSIDSISDLDSDDEEPIIFEVASTQATVITPGAIKVQGGLVDIPKRGPPPPLPPRSSARNSRIDSPSPRSSPLRDSFDDVDLNKPATPGGLTPESTRNSFLSVSSAQAPVIPPRSRTRLNSSEEVPKVEKASPSTPEKEQIQDIPVIHETSKTDEVEEAEEFHSLPPTPGAVQVR